MSVLKQDTWPKSAQFCALRLQDQCERTGEFGDLPGDRAIFSAGIFDALLFAGMCATLNVSGQAEEAGLRGPIHRERGEIAKDMIAARIGPDIPMAIVGSPTYFENHAMQTTPSHLAEHRAINLRLPTSGTLNSWRLKRGDRETRVRVDGPLVFDSIDLIRDAALAGYGLAYLPLDQVQVHLEEGRLSRALARFTPDLPGYHIYYPNRRFASSAFRLLVDTLRYRGD